MYHPVSRLSLFHYRTMKICEDKQSLVTIYKRNLNQPVFKQHTHICSWLDLMISQQRDKNIFDFSWMKHVQ